MQRDKIKETVVKMVDSLIEEVLNERKTEFDTMKAVVRRKKKGFLRQKKIITTTNYTVKDVPRITVDVTPKKEYSEDQIIKVRRRKKRKK